MLPLRPGLSSRAWHPPTPVTRITVMPALLRLLLLLPALILAGCTTMNQPPLRTVPYVDLDRYLGDWHVIANIPYFLENGKVATLKPRGLVA